RRSADSMSRTSYAGAVRGKYRSRGRTSASSVHAGNWEPAYPILAEIVGWATLVTEYELGPKAMRSPSDRIHPSLPDSHQRDGIDETVGQHEVTVRRDRSVAYDVAATRDRPALKLLRLGIEAHDRIRRRPGLAVPDDVADRRDAIGLGFRPARRLPFRHLAGRGIETTEIAARKVAVPDKVVT